MHTYTQTEHTVLGQASWDPDSTNTKTEVKAAFDTKPVYSTLKLSIWDIFSFFSLPQLPRGHISV